MVRPRYKRGRREVGFWAPAYSRHLVYKALAEHVSTPVASRRIRPVDSEPVTTANIAASLRHWGRFNHSVALSGPLDYRERNLPVAPYAFGCWLGDARTGGADITCADQEILAHIRDEKCAACRPVAGAVATRFGTKSFPRSKQERFISTASSKGVAAGCSTGRNSRTASGREEAV